MAIIISDTYADTTPADTNYPYGSAKNETAPGALDGTPIEKAVYDDVLGALQSLLVAGGVVPNGDPDNVQVPQYLSAIFNLRYYARVDYTVGTKVVGSDGVTYVCKTENGPESAVQDPVTESTPRTVWWSEDANMFDKLFGIGRFWLSNDPASPADLFGIGTWVRVSGRSLFGIDGGSNFTQPGSTGGSLTHYHNDTFSVDPHKLTVDEMPEHEHGFSAAQWIGDYTDNGGAPDQRVVVSDSDTEPAGGDQAHSHGFRGSIQSGSSLPPFYATYIWRRTA